MILEKRKKFKNSYIFLKKQGIGFKKTFFVFCLFAIKIIKFGTFRKRLLSRKVAARLLSIATVFFLHALQAQVKHFLGSFILHPV